VGAFIARISRGRTVRQFVLGVLAAPSLFTVLWFAVFGASAIEVDNRVDGAISSQAAEDEAVALFAFLEQYPGELFTSILAIVLIWIFFVAGADAGTVVLGSMSGGVLDPRNMVKITWGVIMAAIAAILLAVGGLDALQNGAILAATPFGILMVAICWSLHRALARDNPERLPAVRRPRSAPEGGEER
jgi:glycine betaine transporter